MASWFLGGGGGGRGTYPPEWEGSLLDPLRLVVPRGDPYYGPIMHKRAMSYTQEAGEWSFSRFDGLWASVGFCLLFLSVRWAWNAVFSRMFRRRAR